MNVILIGQDLSQLFTVTFANCDKDIPNSLVNFLSIITYSNCIMVIENSRQEILQRSYSNTIQGTGPKCR